MGGEGDYVPIVTLSPPRNDSCIKVGSDESHFNVSIRSDGQSHRTVYTNHNPQRLESLVPVRLKVDS